MAVPFKPYNKFSTFLRSVKGIMKITCATIYKVDNKNLNDDRKKTISRASVKRVWVIRTKSLES